MLTAWFTHFAKWAARATGRPVTFVLAVAIILIWALAGPIFGFSDTWQLVINTGTTIVTFLMVFLIQNTQNRDTEALQIKLDELIRAMEGAHNALLDLEELDEAQLDRIRANYAELAEKARGDLQHGREDTKVPDVESKHTATHTYGTDTNEAVRDIVRHWREKAGGGPRWVHVSKLLDELE
jgi:low affinity Fe/Cu permease